MFNPEFFRINTLIKVIPEFPFAPSGMTLVNGMSVIPANLCRPMRQQAGIYITTIFMFVGYHNLQLNTQN
jgi:hypothetical protein